MHAGDGVVKLCAGVFDPKYLESHSAVGKICGGASHSELGTSPDRHFTSERA